MRCLVILSVFALLGCTTEAVKKADKKTDSAAKTDTKSGLDWEKDVLGSAQPVLVDFWATWCGPCQLMNPVVERIGSDFKVVKVDVDLNPKIAGAYNITSIPQFLIFNRGELVARHVGVVDESVLRADLQKALKK